MSDKPNHNFDFSFLGDIVRALTEHSKQHPEYSWSAPVFIFSVFAVFVVIVFFVIRLQLTNQDNRRKKLNEINNISLKQKDL